MGEVERADLEAQSLEFVAKQVRQPSLEWRAYCFTAARLIMEGRFDKGEEFARRCIALGEQFDNREMGRHFWCTMLAPFGERGRIGELEEAALKAVDERPEDITFKAFLSYLYCELDQLPKARLYFEELMAKDLAEFASDDDFVGTLAALAHVCANLRDKTQASRLYDLLLPYAARNVMVGPAAVFGSASRYLGLLSATLGRVDEALGHFEFALRFNQKTGAQPWGAYTRYDWARVLIEQGDPAKRREALDLVRSAAESAQALGLKRLLEKAKALELKADHPVAAGERQNFGGEKPPSAPIIAGNSAEKAITRAVSSSASGNRVFRREGDYWTISYEGATVRLRHSKGLALIAHLIRYPFQDFHVADLAESFGGGSDGRLAADDAASWDGGSPIRFWTRRRSRRLSADWRNCATIWKLAKSLNDPDRAGKAGGRDRLFDRRAVALGWSRRARSLHVFRGGAGPRKNYQRYQGGGEKNSRSECEIRSLSRANDQDWRVLFVHAGFRRRVGMAFLRMI